MWRPSEHLEDGTDDHREAQGGEAVVAPSEDAAGTLARAVATTEALSLTAAEGAQWIFPPSFLTRATAAATCSFVALLLEM